MPAVCSIDAGRVQLAISQPLPDPEEFQGVALVDRSRPNPELAPLGRVRLDQAWQVSVSTHRFSAIAASSRVGQEAIPTLVIGLARSGAPLVASLHDLRQRLPGNEKT